MEASDHAYEAFDKMSESTWNRIMYDDIVQTLLLRCADLVGAEALDLSRARILDLGSGTGGLSLALVERTPVSELTLLDLREDALKKAKLRLHAVAPSTGVTLYAADVHAIPAADNAFDLVISRGSQRFWRDQLRAFQEIRRVMKPGGIAYVGGGRGGLLFQQRRAREDRDWNPDHFGCDRRGERRLPSFMLDDSAYRRQFEAWGDRYRIYAHEGDGHWFCWQKMARAKRQSTNQTDE